MSKSSSMQASSSDDTSHHFRSPQSPPEPTGSADQPPVVGLIVFSHANSFPASTYKVLFGLLRARGFAIAALEKYGHDPRYPVTNNWPHLVRQLTDFADEAARGSQGPVWFVGHSLGGYLSLMAACRRTSPGGRQVEGVLLLDSPLVGGWRAGLLRLAKGTGVAKRFPPGAISRRRRERWAGGPDEIVAHFSRKPTFAGWDKEVLADYAQHGTVEHESGGRQLSFTRDVETSIYNTLPHQLARVLRRHPPPCPVAFIGGTRSNELRQVGIGLTQKVTKGRIQMLEGTHLFPMEHPAVTADAIVDTLRNMGPRGGTVGESTAEVSS
jgi:pimeloyl-ACP methyl ester carboxylesterase